MRETLPEILATQVAAGGVRPDPQQTLVLERLEPLRGWLETHQQRRTGLLSGLFTKPPVVPKGLYLWGGVGRGKSMLMDMFATATDIAMKRRVHFHAFMQDAHHAIHAARQQGLDDPLLPFAEAIIADTRLLAFDEMQITDITDAMIVGRLFEKLFAGGVAIVTTSNRPPEDLYKDGLNRAIFLPFIDLLRAHMDVMELQSPEDYRQHRLAGLQVYFHPAGRSAAAISAIWQDLTAGAQLGPADYLAIAGAVRVLILEDIPQLSASNYNEAKRFVTLIDALYEGHVRLICSAADVPERLYIEGTGSFEFARTASRLREMQSADWAM
jgi:cell division protein ZapE